MVPIDWVRVRNDDTGELDWCTGSVWFIRVRALILPLLKESQLISSSIAMATLKKSVLLAQRLEHWLLVRGRLRAKSKVQTGGNAFEAICLVWHM